MNGYDWHDFWNESHNESKRDEYKKAKKKLSGYLETINKYIREAENEIKGFNTVYSYDPGFYGDIADGFETKSIKYEQQVKGYIDILKSIRDLISNTNDTCGSLYDQYYEACEEEDRIGRAEWEANHK